MFDCLFKVHAMRSICVLFIPVKSLSVQSN